METHPPAAPPATSAFGEDEDDVPPTGAIAVRPRSVSLDALVLHDPKRAIDVVQARIEALGAIRRAALAATSGNDWTVSADKEGRAVATLRASGAQRVRKYYGISVQPAGPVRIVEELGSDNKKRTFAEADGDAICALTGETADGLVGRRGLTEQFIGRAEEVAGLGDLRAAARTSLETKAVKILAGMSAIAPEELALAWGCTVKEATDKCYRGHGFGSSESRRGGGVAGAISEKQVKLVFARLAARARDLGIGVEALKAAFCSRASVDAVEKLPAAKLDRALAWIAEYRAAATGGGAAEDGGDAGREPGEEG